MIVRASAAVVLFLVALVLSGVLPLARFTAEHIAIDLDGTRIRVHGAYIYENPFPVPVTQGFSIPLPPGNEAFALSLTRDSAAVPLRYTFGAYRFALDLRPHESTRVDLTYDQYTPDRKACYLLTTTAPWHRPIDSGTYEIRTNGARVTTSSYALTNNRFERRHFMPAGDWTFAWQ